ncbi:MAG: HlyD family efflux transporter periplasmic adaptor subunit [Planctomycetes bacterium]|nr:HlyD family efflux transporter periplasmic adaptor subunit [Planctomycetota bacterium]
MCLLLAVGCGASKAEKDVPTEKATRGDLVIKITSRGELEAEKSVSVRCPELTRQWGRVKITKLVAEGTDVKKGDLLISLDKTELNLKLRDTESEVKKAAANLENAKKTLVVEEDKLQAKAKSLKAELQIQELKLKYQQELPGATTAQKAKVAMDNAAVAAEHARQDYLPVVELAKGGHVPQEELEIKKLLWDEAEAARKQKALEHQVVLEGAPKIEIEKARLEVAKARIALVRAENELEQRSKQMRLAIEKAQGELALAELECSKMGDTVKKCDLYAPVDGQVVFERIWQEDGRAKVQEGSSVWRGAKLISLPDLSGMIIKVEVEESQVKQVKEGLKAKVRMDAVKDKDFTGTVVKIGKIAQDKGYRTQDMAWLFGKGETSGVKVFDVDIRLDQRDERVKPGLNGDVEIEVETLKNVVSVPLDAVFKPEGQSVVYVKARQGFTTRPVELGKSAENRVAVPKGLEEGEEVALVEPL